MSDPNDGTLTPGTNPTTGPALAPIVVNAQYVKDLSFENPNAPQSLVTQGAQPAVSLNVNVSARTLQPNLFEVLLTINGTAKSGEDIAFIVELDYAGLFSLNNVAAEHIHPLLLIECPRLLFPFARSIIAEATRDGGFPPLFIQPIDFVELYRRQAEAQGAGQPPIGTA